MSDPFAVWIEQLQELVRALQAAAFDAPRDDRDRLLRAASAGNALIRALQALSPS